MDPNLDQRSKHNLIGYLKSKVEGQCTDVLTQDASKSRNGAVHPMIEFLLYSSLTCQQADSIMLRMQNHEDLNNQVKIELIEALKESTPECYWDAHD